MVIGQSRPGRWKGGFSWSKTTNLIKGFLTRRCTQISYDRFLSNPHNIPNSIPQGLPLSPILSILYSTPLLTIRELTLHGISTLVYVDNSVLLTLSSSLSINTTRLQNAYPFLEKALTDISLSVQPKKHKITSPKDQKLVSHWVSISWLTKLKKPKMSNMRAVDFKPLPHALWMSWDRGRPMLRVEEWEQPPNWVPGVMSWLVTLNWTHLVEKLSTWN